MHSIKPVHSLSQISKRQYLFALFLLFCSPFMYAVEPGDSIVLSASVINAFTYEGVDSAKVTVAEIGGDFKAETVTYDIHGDERRLWMQVEGYVPSDVPASKVLMRLTVPRAGSYSITIDKEGYTSLTTVVDIPARRYGRKTREWTAEDMKMVREMSHTLKEVVVTATKVMMIHRGDTIVYNADYFELSHGSMLDKLIEKMPGLELRGSVVFYKGHRLENLLLGGKEFFKGDPAVALENLPAYMVKEVKVYERMPDDDYLNKYSAKTGIPNTLDVTLKRQYEQGWIVNAEVGGGKPLQDSDDLSYLARGFALGYGHYGRLGILGGANNVNNSQMANGDGMWQGSNNMNGRQRGQLGGITYTTESKRVGLSYDTDVKGNVTNNVLQSGSSATQFLPMGDVYKRTASRTDGRQRHLVWNNNLTWKTRLLHLALYTSTDYNNSRTDNISRSAQFAADPLDSYRQASLDSIFTVSTTSQRLDSIIVNRLYQQEHRQGYRFTQKANATLSFVSPLLGNHTKVNADYRYARASEDRFQRYDLRYKDGHGDDLRYRYFDTDNHQYSINASANYDMQNMMSASVAKWLGASVDYAFRHSDETDTRDIFNLHLADEEPAFMLLPSMADWRVKTIDPGNSRTIHDERTGHTVSASLSVKKRLEMHLKPRLAIIDEQYSDSRATTARQHLVMPGFGVRLSHDNLIKIDDVFAYDNSIAFDLSYDISQTPPPTSLLVDVRDDTDPLSVSLGNADLRRTTLHNIHASTSYKTLKLSTEASIQNGSIARGYDYDSRTGVQTYRPQNIDGNWQARASLSYEFNVNCDVSLSYNYNHSVDIIDNNRSIVKNHAVSAKLYFTKRPTSATRLQLDILPLWQYATSQRAGYSTRSTFDIATTLTVSQRLYRDLSIDTDLGLQQRRGYDDKTMNDNNFIWNASAVWNFDFRRSSYHAVGGRAATDSRPWSLRLQACDILCQQPSVRRTLNAQGIVESWSNTHPGYVMLHLLYRWNSKHK